MPTVYSDIGLYIRFLPDLNQKYYSYGSLMKLNFKGAKLC